MKQVTGEELEKILGILKELTKEQEHLCLRNETCLGCPAHEAKIRINTSNNPYDFGCLETLILVKAVRGELK